MVCCSCSHCKAAHSHAACGGMSCCECYTGIASGTLPTSPELWQRANRICMRWGAVSGTVGGRGWKGCGLKCGPLQTCTCTPHACEGVITAQLWCSKAAWLPGREVSRARFTQAGNASRRLQETLTGVCMQGDSCMKYTLWCGVCHCKSFQPMYGRARLPKRLA